MVAKLITLNFDALKAFDADDKTELWSRSPPSYPSLSWVWIKTGGGFIYFYNSGDAVVKLLSAEDGTEFVSEDLNPGTSVYILRAHGDSIYIHFANNVLAKYTAATDGFTLEWSLALTAGMRLKAVSASWVYVRDASTALRTMLNASDGSEAVSSSDGPYRSSYGTWADIYEDSELYEVNVYYLYKFNSSLATQWDVTADQAGNMAIVTSAGLHTNADSGLAQFSKTDGSNNWFSNIQADSPVGGDSNALVADSSGNVYTYDEVGGQVYKVGPGGSQVWSLDEPVVDIAVSEGSIGGTVPPKFWTELEGTQEIRRAD